VEGYGGGWNGEWKRSSTREGRGGYASWGMMTS